MYELQLTIDEYHLFVALPDSREALGNTAARTYLGWNRSRYERARAGLLEKQLVVRARGRGGALRRAPVTDDSDVSVDDAACSVTIRPPVAEAELYEPILATLKTGWSEDRGFNALVIEETAHQGRRPTGGYWTRPDLVAVGMKTFKHVPHQQFEIVTFEVKPMAKLNVIAVFEALAHRRASTHAYVLIEMRNELTDAYVETLGNVQQAATEHGVGVIVFDDPADYETWEEVVVAERSETPPEMLNDFIETQVSQPGQQAIETAIARGRGWVVG